MVIAVGGMASEASFSPFLEPDWAKVAIFDHPREKGGQKHADLVIPKIRSGKFDRIRSSAGKGRANPTGFGHQ
jgi:hypothetical protein